MNNFTLTPQQLFAFYGLAEKLKLTTRHSWLSDGKRQESVAEHSWMMALLAMLLVPKVSTKLSLEKILQLIVVHDLAEAVTTDIPVWETADDKASKEEAEAAAMEKMLATLDPETAEQIRELWQEYEDRQSAEAVFVKAIDTLDVVIQHNVAPIETWNDKDFEWQLSPSQDSYVKIDPYLEAVKKELDAWSIAKAKEAGAVDKLDQVELAKRSDD